MKAKKRLAIPPLYLWNSFPLFVFTVWVSKRTSLALSMKEIQNGVVFPRCLSGTFVWNCSYLLVMWVTDSSWRDLPALHDRNWMSMHWWGSAKLLGGFQFHFLRQRLQIMVVQMSLLLLPGWIELLNMFSRENTYWNSRSY